MCCQKGWMGHSWPVEHGGTGWDATKFTSI